MKIKGGVRGTVGSLTKVPQNLAQSAHLPAP
jgi:hypothetical protein